VHANLNSHLKLVSNWKHGDKVRVLALLEAVKSTGHKLGEWQNGECTVLKHALVTMDPSGVGTVALSDFYNKGLEGWFQFGESVEYLKQLGALDTSDPNAPRVIIPNWITAPSNCIGTGVYHDVCCLSECEPLQAAVEDKLGAPTGSPDTLIAIVSGLSSESKAGNRQLDDVLVQRLHAIAHQHDGVVPIYGRLFAQWMHHAFPRECPYPHLSGSTKPRNIWDFMDNARADPVASKEDMSLLASKKLRRQSDVRQIPWLSEEEVFVDPSFFTPAHLHGMMMLHLAMGIIGLGATAVTVSRMAYFAVRSWSAKPTKDGLEGCKAAGNAIIV